MAKRNGVVADEQTPDERNAAPTTWLMKTKSLSWWRFSKAIYDARATSSVWNSVRLDIERSFWLDRPAPSLIAPLTQNAQYCAVAARHRL